MLILLILKNIFQILQNNHFLLLFNVQICLKHIKRLYVINIKLNFQPEFSFNCYLFVSAQCGEGDQATLLSQFNNYVRSKMILLL
jgi:hypothetical protein